MQTKSIDPERVEAIFLDCVCKSWADSSKHVVVKDGIYYRWLIFLSERLSAHKKEIKAMIDNLPVRFSGTDEEGGSSFLSAIADRRGNRWTDSYITADKLFLLGAGIGKVKCTMSHDLWAMCPGRMPRYVVLS